MTKVEAFMEIRRMSGLDGYPRFPEGEAELAEAAMQSARDVRHLRETITAHMRKSVQALRPSELRRELDPEEDKSYLESWSPEPKTCRFGLCDGNGWRNLSVNGYDASHRCECAASPVPVEDEPPMQPLRRITEADFAKAREGK